RERGGTLPALSFNQLGAWANLRLSSPHRGATRTASFLKPTANGAEGHPENQGRVGGSAGSNSTGGAAGANSRDGTAVRGGQGNRDAERSDRLFLKDRAQARKPSTATLRRAGASGFILALFGGCAGHDCWP